MFIDTGLSSMPGNKLPRCNAGPIIIEAPARFVVPAIVTNVDHLDARLALNA
jgi:hypothetical protein